MDHSKTGNKHSSISMKHRKSHGHRLTHVFYSLAYESFHCMHCSCLECCRTVACVGGGGSGFAHLHCAQASDDRLVLSGARRREVAVGGGEPRAHARECEELVRRLRQELGHDARGSDAVDGLVAAAPLLATCACTCTCTPKNISTD